MPFFLLLISTAITSSPLTSPHFRYARVLIILFIVVTVVFITVAILAVVGNDFYFNLFYTFASIARCASEPPFRTLVRIENFTANCRQRTSHVLFNLRWNQIEAFDLFPITFQIRISKVFRWNYAPCVFIPNSQTFAFAFMRIAFLFDDLTMLCLALLPASFRRSED